MLLPIFQLPYCPIYVSVSCQTHLFVSGNNLTGVAERFTAQEIAPIMPQLHNA